MTVKPKLSTPARVQIHVDPGVDVRHFRRNNRKNASHQHLGLHGPGEHRAEEEETKMTMMMSLMIWPPSMSRQVVWRLRDRDRYPPDTLNYENMKG